jgi:hypothetical protein
MATLLQSPAVSSLNSTVTHRILRFFSTAITFGIFLLVMLLGNWLFKTKMEHGKVLSNVQVPDKYLSISPRLLLPYTFEGGFVRWSPTGLLVTTVLDNISSPETTMLVLSSFLVMVAAIVSWLAFGSWVFTLTFTLIMTFGAQFNYAWVNGSCNVYYLFVAYTLINLLFLYFLFARPNEHVSLARSGFAISLLVLALCWETWLDYFVFLCACCAMGQFLLRRFPDSELRRSLNFIAVTTLTILVPYLAIRLAYGGEHGEAGAEAELLFKHRYAVLMIDDFASNVMTYTYIAFVNFIPYWLAGSPSLASMTDQALVDAQNGYHVQAHHLVPGHYHYFWHFQAGMVFLAFANFLGKLLVRNYHQPTRVSLVLLAFAVLVLSGFATHSLIKFRPYLSQPVLSYKATLSIVGSSLLLSYGSMLAWDRWGFTRLSIGLQVAIWSLILYCSLTHASWHAKILPRVGLAFPPDPLRGIKDCVSPWH